MRRRGRVGLVLGALAARLVEGGCWQRQARARGNHPATAPSTGAVWVCSPAPDRPASPAPAPAAPVEIRLGTSSCAGTLGGDGCGRRTLGSGEVEPLRRVKLKHGVDSKHLVGSRRRQRRRKACRAVVHGQAEIWRRIFELRASTTILLVLVARAVRAGPSSAATSTRLSGCPNSCGQSYTSHGATGGARTCSGDAPGNVPCRLDSVCSCSAREKRAHDVRVGEEGGGGSDSGLKALCRCSSFRPTGPHHMWIFHHLHNNKT